ncbi:MAG: N-acetylmuramoyl-L-alanine amidase [Anaerolineae bacterium]
MVGIGGILIGAIGLVGCANPPPGVVAPPSPAATPTVTPTETPHPTAAPTPTGAATSSPTIATGPAPVAPTVIPEAALAFSTEPCPLLQIAQEPTQVNIIPVQPGERAIDTLVFHYTVGPLEASVGWFRNPASGVSAHYIVGRDGEIVQAVNEWDIAQQAVCPKEGVPDHECFIPNIHLRSIGIELENWGWVEPQPDGSFRTSLGTHYSGSPVALGAPVFGKEYWDPFTQVQLDATRCLVVDILSRHPIPRDRAHFLYDYEVRLRYDPGPLFDIEALLASL